MSACSRKKTHTRVSTGTYLLHSVDISLVFAGSVFVPELLKHLRKHVWLDLDGLIVMPGRVRDVPPPVV